MGQENFMNIFLFSCSRLVRRTPQNVKADLVDLLGQPFQRYSDVKNSIFKRLKTDSHRKKERKTARSENFHS